ncbi:hypothetical protein M093_2345 [Bacteroides uniformis str. 3978 T3 i]|nr:hypothetical protein M093_2345 [Bacteroides uniformis str. 3978 T3 i]
MNISDIADTESVGLRNLSRTFRKFSLCNQVASPFRYLCCRK